MGNSWNKLLIPRCTHPHQLVWLQSDGPEMHLAAWVEQLSHFKAKSRSR
jgi:hypothetical protein